MTEPTWASWPTRAVLAVLAAVVALSAIPIESAAPVHSVAAQQEGLPDEQTRSDGNTSPGDEAPASGEEVIVVLEEGVDPVATAQELGVEPTHIYEDVFTGFAATMPEAAVEEARASGAVQQISHDGRVQAEAQIVGTGVLRVGVPHTPGSQNLDIPSPVNADIAILDTGVSGAHGDLNVVGGKSCIDEKQRKVKKKKKKGKSKKKGKQGNKDKGKKKGQKDKGKQDKGKKGKQGNKDKGKKGKKGNDNKKPQKPRKNKGRKNRGNGTSWRDDNGHGTYVAGIAAAADNGQGIVGVAPGARVWSVKVLDENGSGSFSDVICGLNWVAKGSATIDVVNLSLSGAGSDGPSCASNALHQAICNVVNAGIPVVVAAGNQGTDASTRVPASYEEVITVSGMADSNGAPGGGGPVTCSGEADDTFLSFSNYGLDVDIAAPGDCIHSLWLEGKVRRNSGTSSASPHVAGAVALFIASSGTRPTPAEVRIWLQTVASKPQIAPEGFSGDPDGIPEPMLWLREALQE